MTDPAPHRPCRTPIERVTAVVFILIVLGLLVAEVATNYEPVKLSALLVALFWIPLLVLHEMGHALAAWALGWDVGRIVLGMGRRLGRFTLAGAIVDVNLFPVEGFVVPVPRNLRFPRAKSAAIYFAGPGSEILVVLILIVLVGPDRFFSRSEELTIIAAQSLAIAAGFGVFCNLVPHSGSVNGVAVANDGLGILLSFTLPDAYFAERIGERFDPKDDTWKTGDSADADTGYQQDADWWK